MKVEVHCSLQSRQEARNSLKTGSLLEKTGILLTDHRISDKPP